MARRRSVHEGRMAGTMMRVRVSGLEELAKTPERLRRSQRQMLDAASRRIAEEIARRAPGGASGSVGRSVSGSAISSTRARIAVDHRAARALNSGAYITPKGLRRLSRRKLLAQPRRLRFEVDGKVVFAAAVRLPKRRFVERGLRSRSKIIRQEFDRAFDDIQRSG